MRSAYVYILILCTASGSMQTSSNSSTKPLQLPRVVVPSHYDVFLAYSLKPEVHFPFFGVTRIQLQAIKMTSTITLHALYLNIESSKVIVEKLNKKQIKVEKTSIDAKSETFIIDLEEVLIPRENYTLTIPFYGNLQNSSIYEGVYIGSYKVKPKKTEYMVITKFEPTYARRAFPCFDEPSLKATFNFNLAHPLRYTAISNMPQRLGFEINLMESHWNWIMVLQKFNSYIDDYVWTTFDTTLPMSTYLVAFIISRHGYLESSPHESRIPIKVWTRKQDIAMAKYVKMASPRLVKFYENWLNVYYPLPKLDIAVVPGSACMENWGLITFEESTLYFDKHRSSVTDRYFILNTLAHEIAHQWFGNLVTMNWWSDLWLNEGFACFMSNYGTDALEPQWLSTQLSTSERRRELLEYDASEFTHPVSVKVENSSMISDIFDPISYYKGEALIRMVMIYLGEGNFKASITNYLIKNAYDNTEPNDLWAELTAVSQAHGLMSTNVTVKEIMEVWTKQKGFPLLNVVRNYNSQSVAITQNKFSLIKTELEQNETQFEPWWIPINAMCESKVPESEVLRLQWFSTSDKMEKPLFYDHCSKNNQWLIINAEMMAPCHVNYDDYNWELLSYTINNKKNFTQIPLLSRAQLLGDAFSIAWIDLLSYNITLNMVKCVQHETNLIPLQAAHDGLDKIYGVLKRSSHRQVIQRFLEELLTPIYKLIGGFGSLTELSTTRADDFLTIKRNELIVSWACEAELSSCIDGALDMYNKWSQTNDPDEDSPVPPELVYTVGCVAASLGSLSEWEFLRSRAMACKLLTTRTRLLEAMACTPHVWLLSRQLDMISKEFSESQITEATASFSAVIKNSVGYYMVRDLVLQDINQIYRTFKRFDGLVTIAFDNLLLEVTEQKDLDDLNNLIVKHPDILEKESFRFAYERAKSNIIWMSDCKDSALENMMEIYSKPTRRILVADSNTGNDLSDLTYYFMNMDIVPEATSGTSKRLDSAMYILKFFVLYLHIIIH